IEAQLMERRGPYLDAFSPVGGQREEIARVADEVAAPGTLPGQILGRQPGNAAAQLLGPTEVVLVGKERLSQGPLMADACVEPPGEARDDVEKRVRFPEQTVPQVLQRPLVRCRSQEVSIGEIRKAVLIVASAGLVLRQVPVPASELAPGPLRSI